MTLRTPREAAEELRVKDRQFRNLLKTAEAVIGDRVGIPIGRKKRVFDDADMERIKEALRCSLSSNEAGSGICAGPSEANISMRLQGHRRKLRQRTSASNGKARSSTGPFTGNGAVIALRKPR
jgi:hypothetical protein